MDHVAETIKEIEEKMVETEAYMLALKEGRDTLRKLGNASSPLPRRAAAKSETPKPARRVETENRKSAVGRPDGVRPKWPSLRPGGCGNRSSKYVGVTTAQPTSKGKPRWRAQGRKDDKQKTIGTFRSELEAAIAVQEFLGNKKEAQRLREMAESAESDMAEQGENNPDREQRKRKKAKGKTKDSTLNTQNSAEGTYFECNTCSHKHYTRARPERCRNTEYCRGTSFSMFGPFSPSRRTVKDLK